SIIIYFFHGAIEWNEKIGHTVLALNITNNCTKINSYTNGKWLYGVNGIIAECKYNLVEDQKVRASIKIEGSYDFEMTLETENDVFTLNGTIEIPFSTVQYIQVIGHNKREEVTFRTK
ncbi:Galectin, partial [Meloidogyne graminicola]